MIVRFAATTAIALAGATLTLSTPSIAADTAVTCHGKEATIVGAGEDIVGTTGEDVIVTGSSTDVDAGPGNDLVCVSPRVAVTVSAGPGDDLVDASTSTSDITTDLGTGVDQYVDGSGWNEVSAQGADDQVAGSGRTSIHLVITDPSSGAIGNYSGDGVDVESAELDVRLDLSARRLEVAGAFAASVDVDGGAGVDAPHATLVGDDDNNYLAARGCVIRILGEGGRDRIVANYRGGSEAPQFDCAPRTTVLGGAGPDSIDGSRGRDRLFGNGGSDRILGQQKADHLDGGAGNDWLIASSGNDRLVGGAGSDVLDGNHGRDRVDGSAGRDRCIGEQKSRCER